MGIPRQSLNPRALCSGKTKIKKKRSSIGSGQVQLGQLRSAEIGIGTWQWGNRFLWNYSSDQDEELGLLFEKCVQNGINFFDTADSYGTGNLEGQSEKLLGQFSSRLSPQEADKLIIATKLAAYPWRVTAGSFVNAARASIKRLGRPQLDMAQLHWSCANYAPLQELALWKGLESIAKEGLAKEIGVSNYGPKQLQKISAFLADNGLKLASCQAQYSLLMRDPEVYGLKEACDTLGIQLIAYSPLALGLLTGKYSAKSLPQGPRGFLFRSVLPKIEELNSLISIIAEGKGKTPSQVAINWCICKGTMPIPGAKSMAQVESNLGSAGWRLSSSEVEELDAVASRVGKSGGKMVTNIFMTK